MLLLLSLIGFFSFFFFILKWLLLPRPSPLFPPPQQIPEMRAFTVTFWRSSQSFRADSSETSMPTLRNFLFRSSFLDLHPPNCIFTGYLREAFCLTDPKVFCSALIFFFLCDLLEAYLSKL
jgi:hypothetical protein